MQDAYFVSWDLYYRDTFDRDCPPMVTKKGMGLAQALFYLWQYTLTEGIVQDGRRSFSGFSLDFAPAIEQLECARWLDLRSFYNSIDTFGSQKGLAHFRSYVYGEREQIQKRETYIKGGKQVLEAAAVYHRSLLSAPPDKEDSKNPPDENKRTITGTSKIILSLAEQSSSQDHFLKSLAVE